MLEDWNSQLTEAGEPGALAELGPASSAASAAPPDLFGLDHRAELLARGRGFAVAFTVCNDALFVATSRNFVLRHDLSGDSAAVAELEASKSPDARVRRLFVDPLGRHALLTLQVGGGGGGLLGGGGGAGLESSYLDGQLSRARPLPKLKGLVVTSVAWSPTLRATGFSEALLGTDSGAIYELSLEEGKGKERLQLLAELPGEPGPVAGLAQVALSPERRLVLALCGTRLQAFTGGPTPEALFAAVAAPAPSPRPSGLARCIDLPVQGGAAQLQLLYPARQPEPGAPGVFDMPRPEAFAVLAPSGVYYGRLSLDPSLPDPTDHLVKHQLLPAAALQPPAPSSPVAGGGGGGEVERPLSMALTQYHLVLLYPSKLQYVNRTSKQVVQEVALSRFAAPLRGAATMPLGLCRDQLAGRIYVLAGDDALEVDATGEERDMWRAHLERGDYGAALLHCRTAAQRNAVYLAEAASLFEDGDYVAAASLYGKVTARTPSFEEVALRMMETGEPEAVAAFLQARLDTLGREDKAQATMVATWLTELLLDRLNRALLQRGPAADGPAATQDGGEGDECQQAAARLRAFIQRYTDVLDPGTTVGLLAGYGRLDELQHYARCRGDWEGLLGYLLQRGEAERALEVLRRPSVSPELHYKFAAALMAAQPRLTVQAWMDTQPPLEPRRLLPALLHFGEEAAAAPPSSEATAAASASSVAAQGRSEALRYVRFCLQRLGSQDPAVHNLAVALLSQEADREQELLEHLASARDAAGRPLYDAVAALRMARDQGRRRASVALYCEVGLWEDAVALALTFDPDLATATARRPEGNEALSHKLWLAIARHLVSGGGEGGEGGTPKPERIAAVTRLLDAAGGALRIEDVLPLFPDFVEIDAFKEAICSSLEAYNQEIEGLKREMQVATQTAQAIREDLSRLEHRSAALDSAEPCARCGRPLASPAPAAAGPSGGALPRLYLFPTGNAFHAPCLCAEVSELAPAAQRARIAALTERLAALPEGCAHAPATPGGAPAASVAELRRQLEDEVAVEDPYEGELVARHLSRPYVAPHEQEADGWAL